ncbi:MAG: hypothetical protein JXO51_12195 [Candidatus Aminicenantes bacterium]|nr:hypothetical protein [Candidatus Aminicenantes bacterium]
MISLRDLELDEGDYPLEALSLRVAGGEIYFLLNRPEQANDRLFRLLAGYVRPLRGEIQFDGRPPAIAGRGVPALFIDRVVDPVEFETEARLGDWLDFLCAGGGLDRRRVYETLLLCNFHDRHLRSRVRDLPPEVFKQIYLAVCLAPGHGNIVCNDFIRGAAKGFELKFNKLLLQEKARGRAVLCLGYDIFYASEIADRVGFVKNGRLLLEIGASDLKEMDIKDLYGRFLT